MELPGLALRIRVLWARSIGSYHGRLREDSTSGKSARFGCFSKTVKVHFSSRPRPLPLAGCTWGWRLCVATIGDNGTLTLRLRLPDCLAEEYGKYVVIAGVRFAYGHEQVLAALASNAEYVAYRREHGDKAARASELGQAISCRFKRDGKGWRVFVSTEMMDVPFVTDRRRGASGVHLNADHLAVADTDASGNYLNAWRVPLVTYGEQVCIGVGQTHGVYPDLPVRGADMPEVLF